MLVFFPLNAIDAIYATNATNATNTMQSTNAINTMQSIQMTTTINNDDRQVGGSVENGIHPTPIQELKLSTADQETIDRHRGNDSDEGT